MNKINVKYFVQAYILKTRFTLFKQKHFGHYGGNVQFAYSDKCKNLDKIYIDNDTTILSGARIQVYSDNAKVSIGKRCFLGYNLSILSYKDVYIEDDVLIASNVLITSENHGIDPETEVPYMNQKLVGKEVRIKSGCWIGEKCILLQGVTIGKKSIIGAGSVVTKDIPDYSIAVGNPARVIKRYNFESHNWERI